MTALPSDPAGSAVSPKRTNSLAFSTTECHTCATHGIKCDRRRPKCKTCLAKGWQCGGFATPLSWDDSRIWLGQPTGKSRGSVVSSVDEVQYLAQQERAATSSVDNGKSSSTRKRDKQQGSTFRFVSTVSRPKKRRKGGDLEKDESEVSASNQETNTLVAPMRKTTTNKVSSNNVNSALMEDLNIAAMPPGDCGLDLENASLDVTPTINSPPSFAVSDDTSVPGTAAELPLVHHLIPAQSHFSATAALDSITENFDFSEDPWGIYLDIPLTPHNNTFNLNSGANDCIPFSPITVQQDTAGSIVQMTTETTDREITWFFEKCG